MDHDKYIGRLLDNRYEIQEVLGVGGMAVVYKARCHRLNRLVAIKILKDEHAQDEDFRRRFHAESQAVAMLSHPNIVSVYDVASTGDAHYIVMELIDGITLKQYMEKKGILNWKETLHFAIQIGKALEHAHSRGIVHRDIKPHNVMVLKNGSVKVTDFGIARVMSKSNTLTKEALGSVHYISPEQAKGGRVDNRSDLYSLGVVMYEMITGRPPYDGESPVSVAIQHINGGAKMPSVLNPNIPGGLEQILMKAMAHDPGNRYDTATAMLYDMDEFRKDPTMLFYYNAAALDDVTKLTQADTGAAATAPVKTTAERVVARNENPAGTRTAAAATGTASSRRTERPARSTTPANRQTTPRRRREPVEEDEDRSRVVTIAIISCSVVAFVAIAIFLWIFLNGGWFTTPQNETLIVPDLVGKVYANLNMDDYRGFTIRVGDRQYSTEFEAGEIMSQTPEAADEVVKNTTITVVVSRGEEPKALIMDQDLVGTELANAKNWLIGQGVPEHLILEKQEYSTTVEAGRVTRTDPAYGQEIATGQTVTIWTSLGKEQVFARMPNVEGMDYDAAVQKLNESGFMDVKPEEVDSLEPAGTVLKQSATRYIDTDVTTSIVLQVSKGPAKQVMLNVVGQSFADAEKALGDAGFMDVYAEDVESNEPAGTVVGQSVAADTEIAINDPIKLEVSKGPKEVTMPDVTTKTYEAAEKILKDLGFVTVTRNDVENDAPEGEVVAQSVNKGDKVIVTTEVVLDVSKGPKLATMPNVVGKTFEDAKAELELWGFTVIVRDDVDNNAAAGLVVSQSVAKDAQVPVNTEIVLEVSLGPSAPQTVLMTVTLDLSNVYSEPLEAPYKLELRQSGQVAFVLESCNQAVLDIALEGFSIQYYDIYLDDIFYDTLRVDFDAQ